MGIKEIERMIDRANGLSKKGNNNAARQVLDEAWSQTEYLSEDSAESLRGLICHYSGRIFQALGEYETAVRELEEAIRFRENDLVPRAYSVFQLFICKIYGKLPISDEEVEETKAALTAAMANKAATFADIGNMMHNLAYIEQVIGSVHRAILFYKMTLESRREAGDKRGYALTEARLAECYKEVGDNGLAMSHGKSALEYFEITGDVERTKQVKDIFGWK